MPFAVVPCRVDEQVKMATPIPPLPFDLQVASRRLARGHKGPSGDVAKCRSFLILFSEAGIENVADADDANELVFRYHGHGGADA